jgi:hypothetical protein
MSAVLIFEKSRAGKFFGEVPVTGTLRRGDFQWLEIFSRV